MDGTVKTDLVDWPATYDYPDYNDPDVMRGKLMFDLEQAISEFAAFNDKYHLWAMEEWERLIQAHTRIYMLADRMYRRSMFNDIVGRLDQRS